MALKERDWFDICRMNGEKMIRYLGFSYIGEDEGRGEWRRVDTPRAGGRLADVVARLVQAPPDETEFQAAERVFGLDGLRWYISERTAEEMVAEYSAYYGERGEGSPMRLSEIGPDTPCGCYWFEEDLEGAGSFARRKVG